MKNTKLLLALLICSIPSFAQVDIMGDKQAQKYLRRAPIDSTFLSPKKKEKDKVLIYKSAPEDLRFLGRISFLADLSSGDMMKMFVGGEADFFFPKTFSLHAEYMWPFMDVNRIMGGNGNYNNNNLAPIARATTAEVGGRVYLREEIAKVKHKVVLASHSFGRVTIEYVMYPKLTAKKVIAARGGLYNVSTVVSSSIIGSGYQFGYTNDGASYFTTAHSTGAYAGLSTMVFINSVTSNNYRDGAFMSKAINEIYADVLFANTTFDPLVDASGTHPVIANAPGGFQVSRFGGRLGIKKTHNVKTLKAEIGYRPGVKEAGIYLNFGCAISILP